MQGRGAEKKLEIPPEKWRQLSHRERRSHVNRMRRKYRRTIAAQQREAERKFLESQPDYLEKLCVKERMLEEERIRLEARCMLENAAWLERERLAQEEFRRNRQIEEQRKKEREERERLIREEWEALKEKERAENEAKEKEKLEKEERLKEALSIGEQPPVPDNQRWHNPIAPDDYVATPTDHTPSKDYGTEKDQQNCSFYLKTGSCRFGDRCSRKHPRPSSSRTLLIPAMFSILGLQEQMLNERDQDVALEYDETEVYEDFRKFYKDVLPEFSKAGKVVQFKVSCNHEVHLRGNVYVQYSTEEECAKAFQMFNGRWYAQKQLSCELCPVTKWKNAICGLYNQKRCPKGKHCNFLHVFHDPTGAFLRADRDLPPLSPPHRRLSSGHASPPSDRRYFRRYRRDGWSSRRSSRSRSPQRRHERRRRRSKSTSHSRSRSRDARKRHRRSRSRERTHRGRRRRSRSRSKSRESPSYRYRHKSLSRSPHGSEKSSSRSLSRSRSHSSSSEGSRRHYRHAKKKKKRHRNVSPEGRSKHHRHKSKKKHSHRRHQDAVQDRGDDNGELQDREDGGGKVQDREDEGEVQNRDDKSGEVQDREDEGEVQDRDDKSGKVQDSPVVTQDMHDDIQDTIREVQDIGHSGLV